MKLKKLVLFALLRYLVISPRPTLSSQHSTCSRPQTFTYVHDAVGRGLCSAVNGTARAPDGGSRDDCLRHCAYGLPGCVLYTYYEDELRCEVFDYVCRNYIVRPGCTSYRVSRDTSGG